MTNSRLVSLLVAAMVAVSLSACSGSGLLKKDDGTSIFGSGNNSTKKEEEGRPTRLRDVIFAPDQTESPTRVNRYIWTASLDVLDFLPIENIDPFTGVIVYGFGKPPNGTKLYRATVRVSDPALDARSLRLSLMDENGVVDPALEREVENAILSRARQLRIEELNL